jgi:transketolase
MNNSKPSHVLAERGFFPTAEMETYIQPLSRLNGHPANTKLPGVEASTGPLGHGLPIAIGMALAARQTNASWRTAASKAESTSPFTASCIMSARMWARIAPAEANS